MSRLLCIIAALVVALPAAAAAEQYEDIVRFGDGVTVAIDDVVTGDVIVLGADARVDGTVEGDVVVVGGDLFLGPRARVGGDAVPVAGVVHRAEGAAVAGATVEVDAELPGSEALASLTGPTTGDAAPTSEGALARIAGIAGGSALFAFVLVLGLLFQSAWPERSRNLRRTVEASPGASLLIGALVSGAMILAAAFLTITVVGMIALPAVALLASALWLLGFTALCEALGDRLPLPSAMRSRSGSFLGGLLLLTAFGGLWFVGLPGAALSALVGVGAGSVAVGASVLSRLGRRPFPA